MAAGFIVVELNNRGGTVPWRVWTGNVFEPFTAGAPELQNAAFYATLVDGRAVEGALQAQYPEREIELVGANQGIAFIDAALRPAPPPVPPAPAPTPTTP